VLDLALQVVVQRLLVLVQLRFPLVELLLLGLNLAFAFVERLLALVQADLPVLELSPELRKLLPALVELPLAFVELSFPLVEGCFTLVEFLGLLLDALLALVQRALALVQFGLPAVGAVAVAAGCPLAVRRPRRRCVLVPALAFGRDPVARTVGCRPVRRFVTVRGALGGRLVGVLAVRFVDHTRPNMPEHRYTIGAARSLGSRGNLAHTRHARAAHTPRIPALSVGFSKGFRGDHGLGVTTRR
jgi:hypothetical protein